MMQHSIDLRSDTVTRPGVAMREQMAVAEVGDDVFAEDPTVNRLQQLAARLTGQARALFVPSGTQSNLIGLLSHCQRGDEYIVGQQAHTYKYEAGGAAVLGSIQPQPLELEGDGRLDLQRVAAAIKIDDFHYARTRLLALENTIGGKVLPLDYLREAIAFAGERGLSIHLDGARVCNAAVALGVPVAEITAGFDSVSVCLSKGLGAPVGSLLCGSDELIERALRWRKMVGGGMRQAGILAAAGIYALEHNILRLAEDHANAKRLADGLAGIDSITVAYPANQTNMVFVQLPEARVQPLVERAGQAGIRLSAGNPMRLVTHLDVSADDVEQVIGLFSEFFTG